MRTKTGHFGFYLMNTKVIQCQKVRLFLFFFFNTTQLLISGKMFYRLLLICNSFEIYMKI